jgi:hypothetical protein
VSPTSEAEGQRAAAHRAFATAVGELRHLLEPARLRHHPMSNGAPAQLVAHAIEHVFAVALAAGYSRAMALGMLAQLLRSTEHVDAARHVIATAQLEQLRARELHEAVRP